MLKKVLRDFQLRFRRFQISLEVSERFNGRIRRNSGSLWRFQVVARVFQGVMEYQEACQRVSGTFRGVPWGFIGDSEEIIGF